MKKCEGIHHLLTNNTFLDFKLNLASFPVATLTAFFLHTAKVVNIIMFLDFMKNQKYLYRKINVNIHQFIFKKAKSFLY